MNNALRTGNFTSSEIVALTKPATATTYITEKYIERRLGRSISAEVDARPILWGKLLERRAFDILGTSYELTSDVTFVHPLVPYWVGSPDGFCHQKDAKAVIDFKAPYTLKSFCQLVDSFREGGITALRSGHRDGEKYYQQLVSNACITDKAFAELIVYMPYKSELDAIRLMSEGNPDYYWLWSSVDEKLPYLPDGGYYKNINVLRFPVSSIAKGSLHDLVVKYGKELIQPDQIQKAA